MSYVICTSNKTINIGSDSSTILLLYYGGNKDSSNNIAGNVNKSALSVKNTVSDISVDLMSADSTNTARQIKITVNKNTGDDRTFNIKLSNALGKTSSTSLIIKQSGSVDTSTGMTYNICQYKPPVDTPTEIENDQLFAMAIDILSNNYFIGVHISSISSPENFDMIEAEFGYFNGDITDKSKTQLLSMFTVNCTNSINTPSIYLTLNDIPYDGANLLAYPDDITIKHIFKSSGNYNMVSMSTDSAFCNVDVNNIIVSWY